MNISHEDTKTRSFGVRRLAAAFERELAPASLDSYKTSVSSISKIPSDTGSSAGNLDTTVSSTRSLWSTYSHVSKEAGASSLSKAAASRTHSIWRSRKSEKLFVPSCLRVKYFNAQRGSSLVPMLVVAAVVFGIAWLLLDVVMPTPKLANTREATVFLWNDIPEAVEHAIRANDPALFSPSHLNSKDVFGESRTHYTPSWENGMPGLRPLADTVEQPSWPALFTSMPPAVAAVAPAQEAPVPTKIVFSESLAGRNPSVPKFTPEEMRALPPMEFLIAVRDDGRVAHVFSLATSAAADELEQTATKLLYASTFSNLGSAGVPSASEGVSPSGVASAATSYLVSLATTGEDARAPQRGEAAPILNSKFYILHSYTWGTATILWGNDQ